MKKHRLLFKRIFIFLTLCITAALIYLYFIKPRFIDNNKKIAFDTSLMKEVNETFSIDEYTITLTHYLCDDEMLLAAAVFKVTKEGGKPEAIFRNDSSLDYACFGNRFRFQRDCKAEYKGNDLYIYLMYYRGTGAKKIDLEEQVHIRLYDTGEPRVPNYVRKVYDLSNTEKPVEIKVSEDVSIKISSLGAYMTKESYKKVENMTIVFKDRSKMKLIDSKKNYSFFQEYMYLDRAETDFGKPIDLNDIDYILINGKEFKL